MDESKITEIVGLGWKRPGTINTETIHDIKKNDRFVAQCKGKRKHKSANAAIAEARASKGYLGIYLCPHCNNHHVGKGKERHKVTTKRHRKWLSL